MPAFSVLAWERFDARPRGNGRPNIWNEPADTEFHFNGHRTAGKYLATRLLEDSFDLSYAYQPRREGVPHAFLNTALYLDWDRRGFGYPMLPIAINCYGRALIHSHGRGALIASSKPVDTRSC